MSNTIYVHTLGDSTLDNLYWMLSEGDNLETAKNKSVEGQLKTHLGDGFEVISHAYDGFTTSSVLQGATVGEVLPGKNGTAYERYISEKIISSSGLNAHPLKKLLKNTTEAPTAKHYVVISVGGNDFREHLANPLKLLTITADVQKRYLEIVDQVKKLGTHVQPILMFQYRISTANQGYGIYTILGRLGRVAAAVNTTCVAALGYLGWQLARGKISPVFGIAGCAIAAIVLALSARTLPLKVTLGILKGQNPGITVIGALMEKLYQPILKYAEKEKLPILDLPNSFNPYQKNLYLHEIEPSEKGGALIAQGLANIIKNRNEASSTIYRCDGKTSTNVPEKWAVEYPSKPKSDHGKSK